MTGHCIKSSPIYLCLYIDGSGALKQLEQQVWYRNDIPL